MALIVQKYGGTSVGTVEKIKNVAKRVARTKAQGNDVVVVVSAMSGETNRLLGLAHQISDLPNERELDVVAATGEQVTIGLLAIALTEMGCKAKSFCGFQIFVLTDAAYVKARIRQIRMERARRRMMAAVPKADVVVTNPTHIAVALKYDAEAAAAPLVLAMGERKLAERIKALAASAGVPMVENRPLAHALLATAKVGQQIPASLYAAVAEVLAYVYRRRAGRGE